MAERIGVVWSHGRSIHVGEISFGPGYLAIDDRIQPGAGTWLPAEQVRGVRLAETAEQLRDLPTLVVAGEHRTLSIAPFQPDRLTHVANLLRGLVSRERPGPLHLVIAGGGVAGLEAALAVRQLAPDRVAITLLSAEPVFTYRALSVLEPAGAKTPRISLDSIAQRLELALEVGTLARVDSGRRLAVTETGFQLQYDLLLLTLGAIARPWLPGALTFGPPSVATFAALLDEIDRGRVENVVFAVPRGNTWSLPLYELALLAARRVPATAHTALTVVTNEGQPLGLLGREMSRTVAGLLETAGVRVLTGRTAIRVEATDLVLGDDERVRADHVVTLPRLEGPSVSGLRHDDDGYLPTDRFGHVGDLPTVLAAGDATTFPVKQGGLAAQQAEVAANVIAARAGANIVPAPFEPVLEAQLLVGPTSIYVRSKIQVGLGEESSLSTEPFRQTASKVAAPRLSEFLASQSRNP